MNVDFKSGKSGWGPAYEGRCVMFDVGLFHMYVNTFHSDGKGYLWGLGDSEASTSEGHAGDVESGKRMAMERALVVLKLAEDEIREEQGL